MAEPLTPLGEMVVTAVDQALKAEVDRLTVELEHSQKRVIALRAELMDVYAWLRERPYEPVARYRYHARIAQQEAR